MIWGYPFKTEEERQHYLDYIAIGIVQRYFEGKDKISYEKYCELIPKPSKGDNRNANRKTTNN